MGTADFATGMKVSEVTAAKQSKIRNNKMQPRTGHDPQETKRFLTITET
jgi:hypothetical protein